MLENRKMLSLGSCLQTSHKVTAGKQSGRQDASNQLLIPAHGAPRHEHWMCPLVNSTKNTIVCSHVIHIKSRIAGRAQIFN